MVELWQCGTNHRHWKTDECLSMALSSKWIAGVANNQWRSKLSHDAVVSVNKSPSPLILTRILRMCPSQHRSLRCLAAETLSAMRTWEAVRWMSIQGSDGDVGGMT